MEAGEEAAGEAAGEVAGEAAAAVRWAVDQRRVAVRRRAGGVWRVGVGCVCVCVWSVWSVLRG